MVTKTKQEASASCLNRGPRRMLTMLTGYPRLIEVSGRCPPEDVGGPWGYAELIEAIGDASHERHAEIKERLPEDFDPKKMDADWLVREVDLLAKRWSRKPNKKHPRLA